MNAIFNQNETKEFKLFSLAMCIYNYTWFKNLRLSKRDSHKTFVQVSPIIVCRIQYKKKKNQFHD